MELAKFVVKAGPHGRNWCPVHAEIQATLISEKNRLRLLSDNKMVDFQVANTGGETVKLIWMVEDLPAAGEKTYLLESDSQIAGDGGANGVKLSQESGDRIAVSLDGEYFTTYNYGNSVVRPYLYPVFAGASAGITRNWPMVTDAEDETDDHPHHKGIYTAQGEVNGVDNWGEADGSQIHTGFQKVFNGSVCGGFVEELDWVDSNGLPNMSETRAVTFFRKTTGLKLVDYVVHLHASHGRVVLGDTKEGGLLSIRVAPSMDVVSQNGGTITNAFGGIDEAETWGKRAPWCDYSGPVGGKWYGICMMDHPENPRHPTPWHVRNYGLMTANCFGFHDFTGNPENRHDLIIEAGSSMLWNYRILIHSGNADDSAVSNHYLNYAFPPTVEIIKE